MQNNDKNYEKWLGKAEEDEFVTREAEKALEAVLRIKDFVLSKIGK